MMIPTQKMVPAMEGLFTWPSEAPALVGSRCRSCGTYAFPAYFTCINPACKEKRVEQTTLSRIGKLWSYTIHCYAPPPPFKFTQPFSPFGIGVVELPEGLKVLGMLATVDLNELKVGCEMELIIDKLCDDDDGNELLTWKFAPSAGGSS